MAERFFKKEVQKLYLGQGQEFRGEGILAVTKALLQSGVSYVAGYQGAPISHLMDVLTDANDILEELGVHFEHSASEATAAATLAASVNYPLRGAVTFKSTVGTNVASDALANLASGGVTGGALIVVGEDYGDGSSIMQERSHAFAMKSQMWLLDPRPNLPSIVRAVEQGFELSEATHTPVMLELRIRACHVHGRFIAKDNVRPKFTLKDAMEKPVRDVSRIVLPPASFQHEQEKIHQRWPAAQKYIHEKGLNEIFAEGAQDFGIILQGGMYNTTIRCLELLGLSNAFGDSNIPHYVLNVTYPLIEEEMKNFCLGKRAVLVIEEGQPDFIEQNINSILRKADIQTKVHGKDVLPMAGEYTAAAVTKGVLKFVEMYAPQFNRPPKSPHRGAVHDRKAASHKDRRQRNSPAPALILHRLPGAPDLLRVEISRAQTRPPSRKRRYRLPSLFDPAAVQYWRHHYGLWTRLGGRRRVQYQRKPTSARLASWATVVSGTTGSPAASATRSSIKAIACSWSSTTATQPQPVARIFCRPRQAIRFEGQNSRSRTPCAA